MEKKDSYPVSFCGLQDFQEGRIILINKPSEWTSFDVVNKVRYGLKKALKLKKFKVGHAGTLDPLATGLLVLCAGRMTKQIQYLQADEKVYHAVVFLGETTASLDRETEVESTAPIDHITPEAIAETAASFVGTYDQVPPVFSAKKIDGRRAYKSARKGTEVKMRSAEVNIQKCDLISIEGPLVTLAIHCSKGTYIRSLARDFGERLNTVATLERLHRTVSGRFKIEDAMELEDFLAKVRELPPLEQE